MVVYLLDNILFSVDHFTLLGDNDVVTLIQFSKCCFRVTPPKLLNKECKFQIFYMEKTDKKLTK